MAFIVLLTVLLVFVSITLTSAYSRATRDVLFRQDDESYSMATSEQGSSMIDVENLVEARRLQVLLAGSRATVNKYSRSTSSKSSKKKKAGSKKKTHKSKKGYVSALVGIMIAAIVVTIIIICVIYLFYRKHKTKRAQSLGQEKTDGSSKNQTSKTEDIV